MNPKAHPSNWTSRCTHALTWEGSRHTAHAPQPSLGRQGEHKGARPKLTGTDTNTGTDTGTGTGTDTGAAGLRGGFRAEGRGLARPAAGAWGPGGQCRSTPKPLYSSRPAQHSHQRLQGKPYMGGHFHGACDSACGTNVSQSLHIAITGIFVPNVSLYGMCDIPYCGTRCSPTVAIVAHVVALLWPLWHTL